MAELFVQPKKKTPWWLWLLLLLIILGIAYYFLKGRNQLSSMNTSATDSTSVSATSAASKWSAVDLNGPAVKYKEVPDTGIRVSGNDKYAVYSLGENILFPVNQNTIQRSAEADLKQVAASLKQRYENSDIGVFGRTDSTGTAGQNQKLGADRAEAVKNWLLKNGGIAEGHISVHSVGEAHPLAPNSTAAGRQENRSVQIVALKSDNTPAP
ncbi:OmpA family protein [Mucilaginibacter sp.]